MWNSIPSYANLIFLLNMYLYLLALLITYLKLILPVDTLFRYMNMYGVFLVEAKFFLIHM